MKPSLSALFLFSLLLPACTPAATALPTPSQDERRLAEQAVYVTVFQELFGEPRIYVLMDQTSPGIEGMDVALDSLIPQLTGLDEETAADFRLRNTSPAPVPPDMDLGLPYVLLTRADFDEIFALNTSGWDVFYNRYPNSPGMTTISAVGFNPDLTQALVYVGTMSHWLAGSGYYLFLVKSGGTWQIEQQVMAWIS